MPDPAPHALGPSTGALLLALEDLERRDMLTGRARQVLAGLLDTDCQSSPRASDLYRALHAWDSAGLGSPTRMSTREHELVYCRVAAALLDQLVADRTAKPKLVDEQVVLS